jgi:hypothetical protein
VISRFANAEETPRRWSKRRKSKKKIGLVLEAVKCWNIFLSMGSRGACLFYHFTVMEAHAGRKFI